MALRDDFPEPVKRAIAERAAFLCSKPECRVLTIGPHSDPNKSLSTGVAAHICAAAPQGPRYDPTQTEAQRRSIDNAIWLCHKCSDLIDKDTDRFPADLLRNWKREHEVFVASGGDYPPLPDVHFQTLRGLALPDTGPAKITEDDVQRYRDHVMQVHNKARRSLEHLHCRIQFPEPVVGCQVVQSPTGSVVECRPDRAPLVARASGSGSVSITAGDRPALDYTVSVDELPSQDKLVVRFRSQASDFSYVPYPEAMRMPEAVENYLDGRFQYQLFGKAITRQFISLLQYDTQRRMIASSSSEELTEAASKYRLVRRSSW